MRVPVSHSYTWKFGIALILIAVISLGLMAFSIHWSTMRQFRNYIEEVDSQYTDRLVVGLSKFYSQEEGWSQLQPRLAYFPHSERTRIIITNNSGMVVGDSANELIGKNSEEIDNGDSVPITVSGDIVGKLYVVRSVDASRQLFLISFQPPSREMMPPPPEQRFLSSVINSLWIALAATIVIAFLLGLFLARQITRPLQKLKEGTQRIAAGDLDYRVQISSKDEIGEMARSFNSMASSLEKAEQSRRQLNADIAHELRTPLTVIRGTVDGIIDGVFKPDMEHLDNIKHQTILLTRLTQDIRELSLAESGQLKLECEAVDINELVLRSINQVKTKVLDKNIDFIFNPSPEIPNVRVDPVRVSQAIGNLLSNALQHSPPGSAITISSDRVMDNLENPLDGPAIRVSVADNGKGIDPEHLAHVFERFYRVDDSRARNDGGIGLGLAIVKQMVEAHGGKVTAESAPGSGSVFSLFLPLDT